MKELLLTFLLGFTTSSLAAELPKNIAEEDAKFHPGHYMLVWNSSGKRTFDKIKDNPNILGVQKRYEWFELEPKKGEYDFSEIERDLSYLLSIGKRLVIQIQSKGHEIPVPEYTRTEEYDGGYFEGTGFNKKPHYYAMRWNEKVVEREIALLKALGERFDDEPFIEALVLDETSVGIRKVPKDGPWNKRRWQDPSYTPKKYSDGLMAVMSGAKQAFPNTVVIQYMNYLAGGPKHLADIAAHAYRIGAGIGGPDIKIDRKMPSYRYYEQYAGKMPLGAAVQWDNYVWKNPRTDEVATTEEIMRFGLKELHLDYMFWIVRQPWFGRDVVPAIKKFAPEAPILAEGEA